MSDAGTFQRTGRWPSVLTVGPTTLSGVYLDRIQLFVAKVLANGRLIKERAHRCEGHRRKQ